MSYILPLNVSIFGLNPNAKEFKPTFSKPTNTSSTVNEDNKTNKNNEDVFFDNLEKDFITNNEWLFFL